MNIPPLTAKGLPSRAHVAVMASLAVLLGLLAVLTVAVSPAHASGCTPSPGHVCGGAGTGGGTGGGSGTVPTLPTTPPPTGGGNDGGGGGGTGGHTNTTYTEVTEYYWETTVATGVPVCLGNCGAAASSSIGVSSYYNSLCAPPRTTQWGGYLGVRGFTAWETGDPDGDKDTYNSLITNYLAANYACIDPPHYTDSAVMCAYSVGADWQYRPNAQSALTTIQRAATTYTPFVKGGEKNPSLCDDNYYKDFGFTADEFGQYQLVATGKQTACTYRHYTTANAKTGIMPADEIVGCNGVYDYDQNNYRGQAFCQDPHWTNDWSGYHSFTPEECVTVQDPTWSCGPATDPTLNNAAMPAQGFQVNNSNAGDSLRWKVIQPTGVRSITNKQVRLAYDKGSPFRQGSSVSASNQPFQTTPDIDQWVSGWTAAATSGNKATFGVGFFAAGVPGSPWTAHPEWTMSGKIKFTKVKVTGFNFKTGVAEISKQVYWKRMNLSCAGNAAKINILRPRISNY